MTKAAERLRIGRRGSESGTSVVLARLTDLAGFRMGLDFRYDTRDIHVRCVFQRLLAVCHPLTRRQPALSESRLAPTYVVKEVSYRHRQESEEVSL